MKKSNLLLIALLLLSVPEVFAQHVTFPDDNIQRGYHDRPYKRYEAETGKCQTNGFVLLPSFDQTTLQSEASNQVATQLTDVGSYVQWTNDEAADGLTIRFSLPDTITGAGTKGNLALYVNDQFVQTITLNSYWAWQYTLKSGGNYPDNIPSTTKFTRMSFDEMHVKLENKIPAGATFKLVKTDHNGTAYTIDFVELEPVPDPVTFESIPDANKVIYDSSSPLDVFIYQNGGKTIYLPAGVYAQANKIQILNDNTKIIGAGMWYTEIYFTASSDVRATYANRGIQTDNSQVVIDGLYLNTINNKRYYNNNSSFQVGKGFMGGLGTNSIIRNVWVEHFECGGWIANYDGKGANNLLVENCRFRNNYADGLNLSTGVQNAVVQHCSFRNNGDDDMASWSTGQLSVNNTFRFNTAENNWRASSLGFFGGQQNKALNCVIIDPMEAGLRATCDFTGTGFSTVGYTEFRNISIYRGGVAAGAIGVTGDFFGNQQGAVHLNSSSNYNLTNIKLDSIDLYNSKNNAVYIGSGSYNVANLIMNEIHINGTGQYGIYYNNAKGNGSYCNISYTNIGATTNTNTKPATFTFTEDCSDTAVPETSTTKFHITSTKDSITISGFTNSSVSLYDVMGNKQCQTAVLSDEAVIPNLIPGIYLVRLDSYNQAIKVLVR
ncbi:MAG: right-handed parallel beta-helix repeat-containing protein [Bacteroidota bacterium]|nr:right-handed parallel beta-helix repeat-containing protein [Bacteroidota bacterium]